ncbi:MAG: hypothetical protein NT001_03840 [Candidatus Woesearchaeota archaeon]|nr:hypothetical protein [Candidatus Woesearchaeota archaeon]
MIKKSKQIVGFERSEYTLKNGATVEIIREKVIEDDLGLDFDCDELLKEIE